ncbi:chaperone protein DnaJ-like [Scylla paramamosain]|uniref:chaperone protein DnaJ-like n=1 Tax=Scylla paramamosain TaxID=85552 RepID=UPI003082D1D4
MAEILAKLAPHYPGNIHALLGVAHDAPLERAYRRKGLEFHPDKNPGNAANATVRFQQLQAAYEMICRNKEAGGEPEANWFTPPLSYLPRQDWAGREGSREGGWALLTLGGRGKMGECGHDVTNHSSGSAGTPPPVGQEAEVKANASWQGEVRGEQRGCEGVRVLVVVEGGGKCEGNVGEMSWGSVREVQPLNFLYSTQEACSRFLPPRMFL